MQLQIYLLSQLLDALLFLGGIFFYRVASIPAISSASDQCNHRHRHFLGKNQQ